MQEFIQNCEEEEELFARDLDYGQLGIITHGLCKGFILTKTYSEIVCVYSPDNSLESKAFFTAWDHSCSIKVRLLKRGEKVILSNE